HVICAFLFCLAMIAGALYARWTGQWISFILVIWTAALITFYDYAAKYLVAPGLLSLGLIRFFHALVPAPQVPLLWHPLLLLNHVTVLSLVAYRWEEKRPALTPIHWIVTLSGLVVIDGLFIGLLAWRRMATQTSFAAALWVKPALLAPAVAAAIFLTLVWFIRRRSSSAREAGQRLMLYGLLWLILY